MYTTNSKAPDFVKETARWLGRRWMQTNQADAFLFYGACDCEEARSTQAFITGFEPILMCPYCGKPVQGRPLWKLINGNWEILEGVSADKSGVYIKTLSMGNTYSPVPDVESA